MVMPACRRRFRLRARIVAVTHAPHNHSGSLDDWSELAATAVRRQLGATVLLILVLALVGLAVWWPRGEPQLNRESLGFGERIDATVTAAGDGPCSFDESADCRTVELRIGSGPSAGAEATIETDRSSRTPAASLAVGDAVVLNDAGESVPQEARYSFADVRRTQPLVLLAVVFSLAVVALGRLRGLLALAGIGLTFAVLVWFIFPALLHGSPPVGVALTGAALIAFGTLYLAHGVNERTTVALLGTLASLLLIAALAAIFAGAARLSGLASEESLSLLTFAPELDFRGLLLAAVIVGALGVLDDVTVTQVAAVWELHRTDPSIGARELFRAGTRIGRDHIAATVNTLVLAYSAAALPLLLIFTQSGLGTDDILTSEVVAVEVVQTLVGSIGLVAAVPVTTALACWVLSRVTRESDVRPEPPADDPPWEEWRTWRADGYGSPGGAHLDPTS
jgi:uncharacterized membrane protein